MIKYAVNTTMNLENATVVRIISRIDENAFTVQRVLMYKNIPGKYREFITYNEFGKLQDLPENIEKIEPVSEEIVEKYCMGSRKLFSELKSEEFNEEDYAVIHDNGGRPYIVRFYNDYSLVKIYALPDCYDDREEDNDDDYKKYTQLVAEYTPEKVFIPQGYVTEFQFGHFHEHKSCRGNTILLKLSNKKYVYVERCVYVFTLKDEIEHYYSLIGNNDVPYPIAVGKKNIYNIASFQYAKRSLFPEFKRKYIIDLACVFYGHTMSELGIKNKTKNIKRKIIHSSP